MAYDRNDHTVEHAGMALKFILACGFFHQYEDGFAILVLGGEEMEEEDGTKWDVITRYVFPECDSYGDLPREVHQIIGFCSNERKKAKDRLRPTSWRQFAEVEFAEICRLHKKNLEEERKRIKVQKAPPMLSDMWGMRRKLLRHSWWYLELNYPI